MRPPGLPTFCMLSTTMARTAPPAGPPTRSAFDDPRGVAGLLEELRKTGADVAVTALAARAADAELSYLPEGQSSLGTAVHIRLGTGWCPVAPMELARPDHDGAELAWGFSWRAEMPGVAVVIRSAVQNHR